MISSERYIAGTWHDKMCRNWEYYRRNVAFCDGGRISSFVQGVSVGWENQARLFVVAVEVAQHGGDRRVLHLWDRKHQTVPHLFDRPQIFASILSVGSGKHDVDTGRQIISL